VHVNGIVQVKTFDIKIFERLDTFRPGQMIGNGNAMKSTPTTKKTPSGSSGGTQRTITSFFKSPATQPKTPLASKTSNALNESNILSLSSSNKDDGDKLQFERATPNPKARGSNTPLSKAVSLSKTLSGSDIDMDVDDDVEDETIGRRRVSLILSW
jgi:hypothetical protein